MAKLKIFDNWGAVVRQWADIWGWKAGDTCLPNICQCDRLWYLERQSMPAEPLALGKWLEKVQMWMATGFFPHLATPCKTNSEQRKQLASRDESKCSSANGDSFYLWSTPGVDWESRTCCFSTVRKATVFVLQTEAVVWSGSEEAAGPGDKTVALNCFPNG